MTTACTCGGRTAPRSGRRRSSTESELSPSPGSRPRQRRRSWNAYGRNTVPDHDVAGFDRLCRTVYIAVRAGEVDCTDAFDLAVAVLKSRPTDHDATELASLSIDCT